VLELVFDHYIAAAQRQHLFEELVSWTGPTAGDRGWSHVLGHLAAPDDRDDEGITGDRLCFLVARPSNDWPEPER
jgi:hypothetical protein